MIAFCFWGILSVAALCSVISLAKDVHYIWRGISSFYFRPAYKAITINIKLAPPSPSFLDHGAFLPLLLIPENMTNKNKKITL